MKKIFILPLALVIIASLTSCVGKKKYLEVLESRNSLEIVLVDTQEKLKICEEEKNDLMTQLATQETKLANRQNEVESLKEQMDFLQKTNTNLLDRLSDLSIISKAGAENIRQSLEQINQQSSYIQDLTSSIAARDSLNLALVVNLKRSLDDINDEDVEIEVKGGVVYVSLSDKMLYKSGSAVISSRADEVLGKVAKIIKDRPQLEVMVVGHTDNVPIKNSCIDDNWDLSVKRATAVVRNLQENHSVDAQRMTAAGRGEYRPKATNETREGRSTNRRTEVILAPKLDQFFELFEADITGEE